MLLPRHLISRWKRRISNSLRSLSIAQRLGHCLIFSGSLAPTFAPAGGRTSCSYGECARTFWCCIFALRYFANRFATGSWAIPLLSSEPASEEGRCWIPSLCSTHFKIDSSHDLGGGSPMEPCFAMAASWRALMNRLGPSRWFPARFWKAIFFLASILARAPSCESSLSASSVLRRELNTCWRLSPSSRRVCHGNWKLRDRATFQLTARS